MEKQHLCSKSTNELIKKFSQALVNNGVIEGSQYYYTDDDFKLPFFKLPKAYKKEKNEDPDVHHIFVDIDNNTAAQATEEYIVQLNYVHEHIADADRAAKLVAQLISGEMVEVAIVYPDRMAGFYAKNTGDHKKNVDIIGENFGEIRVHLERDLNSFAGGHMHVLLPCIYPNYLQFGPSTKHRIPGINIYLVSSVFAEHPEFYVVQ